MKEYQKIHTIWKRDDKGHVTPGKYSLPEFEYLKDVLWEFTEKVDGTNVRVNWDGGASQYGGRTDNASLPAGLVQHLRDRVTETNLASVFGTDAVTLYGEGYGAKIQAGGGNYKPDGQGFVLFDVLAGNWWLKRGDVEDVALKLGIPVVPLVLIGTLADAEKKVAAGFDSTWGPFRAEGLVGRTPLGLKDRRGDRLLVKLKTKDYAHLVTPEG